MIGNNSIYSISEIIGFMRNKVNFEELKNDNSNYKSYHRY